MTKHPAILTAPVLVGFLRSPWTPLLGVIVLTAAVWIIPRPEMPSGLRARYFAHADWSGPPIAERVDTDISSAALAARPELEGLTTYSVEWSGSLIARTDGLHRLATKSDDGSWLWIDDRLVIENGGIHPTRNVTADVLLSRGVHAIRVRYMEGGGDSFLQLGQAAMGGQFGSIGPLVPDAMSYAEFRARELWPLALVLLWYLAVGRALWLALRHVRWFPHLRALADAASDRTFLIVALVGVLTSAAHIGYGLPAYESLSGDELAPLDTLMASHDAFRNWNLRWPPLHLQLIALTVQPFEWAATLFGLPLVDHTVHALMFLAVRGLSLAMLCATLLLTFDAALELADRVTGYFAVALLASMPVVVYFGSLANLETPQMFWATLALWAWLKFVRWRDLASSIVLGSVVGLGLASKDQLYGFYLAAPCALAYVLARDARPGGFAPALLAAAVDRRFLAVGVATLIGFAVGHQLPMEWERLAAHIRSMTSDSVPFRVFSHTLAGHAELLVTTMKSFVWAAGWPGAVAFVGGCLYVAFSGRLRLLASLLLPLATYYLFFLAVILYVYDRFLIAFLPVAALVGGMFLQAFVRAAWLPQLVRVAVPTAVLTLAAANAVAINVVFHSDPRHVGREWLARHVACGSSVGVIYRGAYLPPLDCYSIWPLIPSRLDGMVRWPDYLVLNNAYAQRFLATASGPRFLRRLQSGELGYRRVLRAATSPPRWAPLYWEARFRNAEEDGETTLDKPLNTIEVWELIRHR